MVWNNEVLFWAKFYVIYGQEPGVGGAVISQGFWSFNFGV
jgi:hypothetical protein